MLQTLKRDLLNKLIDSMTVIRGNAQLAKEADHVKWSRKHIELIIDEIDRTSALLNSIDAIAELESVSIKNNKKAIAALS